MIQLAISPAEGDPFEVVVPGGALLEWEKTHNQPYSEAMNSGRAQWLYELAHASLVRRQGEQRAFETWCETIDDVRLLPLDVEATLVALTLAMSAAAVQEVADTLGGIAEAKRVVEAGGTPVPVAEAPPEVPTGGDPDPSLDESPAS